MRRQAAVMFIGVALLVRRGAADQELKGPAAADVARAGGVAFLAFLAGLVASFAAYALFAGSWQDPRAFYFGKGSARSAMNAGAACAAALGVALWARGGGGGGCGGKCACCHAAACCDDPCNARSLAAPARARASLFGVFFLFDVLLFVVGLAEPQVAWPFFWPAVFLCLGAGLDAALAWWAARQWHATLESSGDAAAWRWALVDGVALFLPLLFALDPALFVVNTFGHV